ncbi:cid1 [Moniliophthora roreri MCA 2997]|uniref:polynucleotide adenylyltransferase n=2 Tax=Moniliophthora roreri TaxID=221103 RepID=V2YQH1_MONRO|nr:cid1 [Moniliophthora roreri MCA 2997]
MAYPQTMSQQSIQQQYRGDVNPPAIPPQRRQQSKQRFVTELSQCLVDFVIQLLPTQEELAVKEDVRKLLERLIRTIEPQSRLLSFGSTANGFSLRNSDMDLCCLIDSEERLAASDLVTMLGDLLERETKFHVKPLPHARIPIVKLSLDPSPGLPFGIACDIGFENRLALENTRLLMCYAMIDPTRVRTMVLFLKVWSKRRKINSPYKGTLSSYGYVLLVIYFLVHVKNPPVLPNLQQMPPLRPISKEETHLNGHNIWFFDDIDLLRQRWRSENTETVAELLIDFFRYFSKEFLYNTAVASIRAGLIKKEAKGWQNDLSASRYNDARERNRFCIEDPFETDFNVARCVTKDGLYTIRGEFMRASRVLAARPERAILALADLCEERKDEDLVTAPASFAPPPQTPYTVGSRPMRSKTGPAQDKLSLPVKLSEPSPLQSQHVQSRPPPEHMAPKRGKWTSPPPPEASSADHSLYESQLGAGLELATAATEAREKEDAYNSSSSNSEILEDEDRSDAASDDVRSIHSFTEGSSVAAGPSFRRPSWIASAPPLRLAPVQIDLTSEPPSKFVPGPRGRLTRLDRGENSPSPSPSPRFLGSPPISYKQDPSKRSSSASNPPRSGRGISWSPKTPSALNIPLPPSPDSPNNPDFSEPATVFYQTGHTRSPRPTFVYPSPGSHSPILSTNTHHPYYMGAIPRDIFPSNLPPALSSLRGYVNGAGDVQASSRYSDGPNTPTPTSFSSHSHSHSTSTIHAPTPPPNVSNFSQKAANQSSLNQSSSSPSSSHHGTASLTRPRSCSRSKHDQQSPSGAADDNILDDLGQGNAMSPEPSASTSNGSSPTPSSTGYATSISRSPSPRSLSPTEPPISLKPFPPNKFSCEASLTTPLDGDGAHIEQMSLVESPKGAAAIKVEIVKVNGHHQDFEGR